MASNFDPWAGLVQGLTGGIEQMQQQRRLRQQEQRQQQMLMLEQEQEVRQAKAMAQQNFLTRLQAMTPEMDVDPSILQEASSYGMAGLFQRTPQGVRRKKTISDQIRDLELDTEGRTNQIARQKQRLQTEMLDPGFAAKLLTLPLPQRRVEAQKFGIEAPLTSAERLEEAKMSPNYLSSLIYGPRAGLGGQMTANQAHSQALKQALAVAGKDALGRQNPPDQDLIAALTKQFLKGEFDITDVEEPQTVEAPQQESGGGIMEWFKGLFSGGNQAQTQQPARPTIQQPQRQTGKTITLREVQQLAQRNGVDVNAAINEFTAQGYTITR